MPYIEWKKNLRVGIPEIDKQHQQWISLINFLNYSIHEDRDYDIYRTVLRDMMTITLVNFKTEEEMMAQVKYPYIDIHKKEHSIFVRRVQEFVDANVNREKVPSVEVVQFIKIWAFNHLTSSDQGFARFISGSNGSVQEQTLIFP